MEDAAASKTKPGILLLIAAVLLLVMRAFLHYAIAMRRSGNPSYAIGYSAARAVIAPMLFGGSSAFQGKVAQLDDLPSAS